MLLNNVRTAVFIGAHTDDEMICAGTLRKLINTGTEVHVIACSFARTKNDPPEVSKKILKREFASAMEILGVPEERRWLLDLETRNLPQQREIIRQSVYDFVEKNHPDIAFVLSPNDDHQDHQVVGEESERVMKGRVGSVIRCQYPWNYKMFHPNLYVLLSEEEIQAKLKLIGAYQSQMFRYDYVDLFRSFARADALSIKENAAGAEKFEILRSVIPITKKGGTI